jgi:hypothetical protein
MSRTAASASAQRPRRTPIGGRNILTVQGKDANFEYRIVNDSGDRIQQFLDAGYELVDASTVQVGDKRVNAATPVGSKAQVSVGKGEKAFVMRIPKEFYIEDQLTKKARIDALEHSIKQTASSSADYGKVSITNGNS